MSLIRHLVARVLQPEAGLRPLVDNPFAAPRLDDALLAAPMETPAPALHPDVPAHAPLGSPTTQPTPAAPRAPTLQPPRTQARAPAPPRDDARASRLAPGAGTSTQDAGDAALPASSKRDANAPSEAPPARSSVAEDITQWLGSAPHFAPRTRARGRPARDAAAPAHAASPSEADSRPRLAERDAASLHEARELSVHSSVGLDPSRRDRPARTAEALGRYLAGRSAPREQAPASTAPTPVEVSIGRIEIRAQNAAPTARTSAAPPRRAPSLSDYLAERSGGKR